MTAEFFTDGQLQAISNALGDTTDGLTGSEIDFLFTACRLVDYAPGMNKRTKIYNAFAHSQNTRQDRKGILAFIRKSMRPERYLKNPDKFETLRRLLNEALAFAELAVTVNGELVEVERATTIDQAKLRANDLRADLIRRGVHADVLKFCRAELVANNYFHAVLEAVKSLLDKIRMLSGLSEDGVPLIEKAIGGHSPFIQINALGRPSEIGEQKGFAFFLKGLVGMFRNTTAHEARINWEINKEDAEDLLSAVSFAHRRLDKAISFNVQSAPNNDQ